MKKHFSIKFLNFKNHLNFSQSVYFTGLDTEAEFMSPQFVKIKYIEKCFKLIYVKNRAIRHSQFEKYKLIYIRSLIRRLTQYKWVKKRSK
jgi:hypothetical protein